MNLLLEEELEQRENKWIEFNWRDNFIECTNTNGYNQRGQIGCKQNCSYCEYSKNDFSELVDKEIIISINPKVHKEIMDYDTFIEKIKENYLNDGESIFYRNKKETKIEKENKFPEEGICIHLCNKNNALELYNWLLEHFNEQYRDIPFDKNNWIYLMPKTDTRKWLIYFRTNVHNKPIYKKALEFHSEISFKKYAEMHSEYKKDKEIYQDKQKHNLYPWNFTTNELRKETNLDVIKEEEIINNKGEKEMSNVTKKEEFSMAEYTVCCPGANKENTNVNVDSKESKIRIEFSNTSSCTGNVVEITVASRYDLKKTSANIKDGVMTIKVPVYEDVVTVVNVE